MSPIAILSHLSSAKAAGPLTTMLLKGRKEKNRKKKKWIERCVCVCLGVGAGVGMCVCLLAVFLPGSEARHGDGRGQAIVQVIEGALVGQQEGEAVGKSCKSDGENQEI